jgi:cbb3-type cytochrome oxidase subunit 1
MSARLIKVAAFYLVLGVTMGIVMGITHQFELAPVHAHINLFGFATLAIVGVIYHAYPAAAQTRLATAHFWIHVTMLPVFMVGLACALTGHEAFLPVTTVGALGVAIGIVVLAINLWRTVSPLARSPSLSVPSARAVV